MLGLQRPGWPVAPAPALTPEAAERLRADTAEKQRIADARTAAIATINAYGVAAHLSRKVYPEPLSRLVRDQLEWWCEIGHRLAPSAQTVELYAQVMEDARKAGLA